MLPEEIEIGLAYYLSIEENVLEHYLKKSLASIYLINIKTLMRLF